jgi:DNA-binding IscR family transcriptional regulator
MRVSAKADYGVRAALELAAAPDGGTVKGERIAEAQSIPRPAHHRLLDTRRRRIVP